jgi:glycogen debranching enzyme
MAHPTQEVPRKSDRGEEPQSHAHERKRRVLNHGRSSVTGSVAGAQVIKDGSVFFLCEPDGRVPLGGQHGMGLYYHDCRYLDGYELHVANVTLDLLASTAVEGFAASIELTNPDIRSRGHLVEKEQVAIRWRRTVDDKQPALHDEIAFRNFGQDAVDFPASLQFGTSFESVFTVRGLVPEKRGTVHEPRWQDGQLRFAYDGADDVRRELRVGFSPEPASRDADGARFDVHVEPGQAATVTVTLTIVESSASGEHPYGAPSNARADAVALHSDKRRAELAWLAGQTRVETDSTLLGRVINRSLRDLHLLENERQGRRYYSAGVPWYVALFGRDSLIASYQTLAYKPAMAENTLRLLGAMQGTRHDEWRDEDPGKILHELRVGEMAHLDEIPQTPYYGSVDSTPLFLALVARHAAWTGSLGLFQQLRPHIERALEWIDKYGDQNHDGFVEYAGGSSKGLSNQGWKDSGDSIMNADGSLCTPPISLVEVQGYVYMAKRGLADLYRRGGDAKRGDELERQADHLRERFNTTYWLDDLGFYALALQKGGTPASVVASNPGQALWAGIVDRERAGATVRTLLSDEMYSGWGIRTLSTKEKRFNPIGYHLGTVWPHDNSIIASGFRRYGFLDEACRVFTGIVEAAGHFPHSRLPEVFAGFARTEFPEPVRYPVACHPQAWAAGAVPFLLETLLGFEPDAFNKRLRVVEPVLPEFVRMVCLRGVQVGNARVDLRFERPPRGKVTVDVLNVDGELDVQVDEL